MECVTCVCVWLGWCGCRGGEWMRELGFGLHQSCGDRGSIGHVSVCWLRWCRWVLGRGLGPGLGVVGWCYVCVRCESGLSV